jgi:hypothetical protein
VAAEASTVSRFNGSTQPSLALLFADRSLANVWYQTKSSLTLPVTFERPIRRKRSVCGVTVIVKSRLGGAWSDSLKTFVSMPSLVRAMVGFSHRRPKRTCAFELSGSPGDPGDALWAEARDATTRMDRAIANARVRVRDCPRGLKVSTRR